MVTFVLVHGTFASKSRWPHPGSPIRAALAEVAKAAGEQARFKRVVWTGKNRIEDRRAASDQISEIVIRSRPDEQFILIGHSHGGSAIAYYLCQEKQGNNKILGCIFLSTPFVAIRERTRSKEIITSSFMTLVLVFTFLFGEIFNNYFGRNWGPVVLLLVCIPFCAPAITALNIKRLSLIDRINKQQTSYLPNKNYLFIRTSGDEAASILAFSQFAAWLSARFSHYFEVALIRNRRLSLAKYLAVMIAISISSSYLPSGLNFVRFVFDAFEFSKVSFSQSLIEISITALLVTLTLIALIIVTLFTLGALVALSLIGTQALLFKMFGLTSFTDGFLLDIAVEPLPFGRHELTHIPWSSRAGTPDFTHSWTYEDLSALARIKAWTIETLTLVRDARDGGIEFKPPP